MTGRAGPTERRMGVLIAPTRLLRAHRKRQLFHLSILEWHDANSDLRRLAEVRTIECNRRNRPQLFAPHDRLRRGVQGM
jgi:hypothetical protein